MSGLNRSDAPAPMAQFTQAFYAVSDENQRLLDEQRIKHKKILDKKSLKIARSRLDAIQAKLDAHNVEDMLSNYQSLLDEFETLKRQYTRAKEKCAISPDDENIKTDIITIRENHVTLMADIKIIRARLRPYRKLIVSRDTLAGRISEHENMVLDQKQMIEDAKEMQREANIFAGLIVKTWNRLGYKYSIMRKGKMLTRSVRFEKIIATPDEIQLKVDVSQLGLWDGTVHNLPAGIKGYQLVEPDTLRELKIACEREITSPNIDGDAEWSKGIWLQLFRSNYAGGIMEYVSYQHVMERYPYDDRDKFPLPMGIKAGRYINWVNLVDHPHWLFSGQTGSGKTNAVRVGLSTYVMQHSPAEIQFLLIDLKQGGDLDPYAKTPHCIGSVIRNVEGVAVAMEGVVKMMRDRMGQIRKVTNDIADYNAIVDPANRMPRIVIVFDEYAAIGSAGKDLKKEIDSQVRLIATQSRAAGIHLWIGTQQTYSDSIDKQIKGNITFVLGGRQRTQGASMSVFSNASAMQTKKIAGRMLCDDGENTYPVQIPYLSKSDLKKSIASTAKWDAPPVVNLDDVIRQEQVKHEDSALDEFNSDLVIKTALNEFDGMLTGIKIWKFLDRADVSQRKVYAEIKKIASESVINFDGETYQIEKDRNKYKLCKILTSHEKVSA